MKEELLLKEIVPKALELWDVNPKKISLPLQSENTVFKIEDSNGNNFALRISKEGRHHFNEFTSEYLWMSHLADIGLKVPKTVLSIEREAFVEIENTLSKHPSVSIAAVVGRSTIKLTPSCNEKRGCKKYI